MPPRYAYWTIILEGKATAFRAQTREELLPTLKQLQVRHPDAVLMWFARGKLWASPEEERDAGRRPRGEGERRGAAWRPGGQHRDPRDRFKVPRDEKRRRFSAKLRRDRHDGGEPGRGPRETPTSGEGRPERPEWKPRPERPAGPRPERKPQSERPGGPRPEWKPQSERPRGPRPESKPQSERPRGPRPEWTPKSDRPRGPREDWRPRPEGQRKDEPRPGPRPDRPSGPRSEWKPRPEGPRGPSRSGWKPGGRPDRGGFGGPGGRPRGPRPPGGGGRKPGGGNRGGGSR